MRQTALLCSLLIAMSSAIAHAAATSPPGVNLAWDKCFGDGGAQNRAFACDVSTGSERLVYSLELDAPIDGVTGMELVTDIHASSPVLPVWWGMLTPGSCRSTALTATIGVAPPGSVNCADWTAGFGAGGIANYSAGSFTPAQARMLAAVGVPSPGTTLLAGQEYFVMSANVSHAKSTGAGACVGCDIPVCICFQQVNITSGTSSSTVLNRGANYSGSPFVRWQNGYPTNVDHICLVPRCAHTETVFECVLATPTGSRRSAWSQVKALYR